MRDETPHVATASLIRAYTGERRQLVITCRVVFINQLGREEQTRRKAERERGHESILEPKEKEQETITQNLSHFAANHCG